MARVVLVAGLVIVGLAGRGDSWSALHSSTGPVGPASALAARTAGDQAASGRSTAPSFEQVKQWVQSYRATHRGKDADINAKSPREIAADPAARQLLSLCGAHQRPVIPLLAWEYGGFDHPWKNPEESALVYCVYTPVSTPSPNWTYDAREGHVTADVYVLFPDENPCRDRAGADQAAACIGDPSNFEILVDTASINDGRDAGLSLASASTELRLILREGTKVRLWYDR